MDGYSGYALQKLELAIDDLATGSGDVRSRLNFAFRDHLHVLRESDFPEELKSEWTWILRKLTRIEPLRNQCGEVIIGSVERTLRRMHNSTGTKIAKRVIRLAAMLRGSLEERAKRR